MEHKAPEHQYERLTDAESRQKEELFNLMTESKTKITECDQVSTQLENALSELQVQHDQAKDLVTETFQSYKAILEKCKDNALDELEKLHSNMELEIMDTFHRYTYTPFDHRHSRALRQSEHFLHLKNLFAASKKLWRK